MGSYVQCLLCGAEEEEDAGSREGGGDGETLKGVLGWWMAVTWMLCMEGMMGLMSNDNDLGG